MANVLSFAARTVFRAFSCSFPDLLSNMSRVSKVNRSPHIFVFGFLLVPFPDRTIQTGESYAAGRPVEAARGAEIRGGGHGL